MRLALLCLGLFLLASTFSEVRSMTNQEFYELLKPYTSDEEAYSNQDNNDNDVVLPGGPDDQVDFDNVIKQLGMDGKLEELMKSNLPEDIDDRDIQENEMEELAGSNEMTNTDDDVTGGMSDDVKGGYCRCRRRSCNCCYSRRFRVWRRRFTVRVCAYLGYSSRGIYFKLTLNGRTVYRRTIRSSIRVCYKVPYTFGLARACAEVYRINLRRRSFCIRLYAKAWRYRVTFARRCFRLRGSDMVDDELNYDNMFLE